MKKIPFRTYTILAASAWLIVVSLLNVFAEKTDVSWNENRTLQEMPSTQPATLFSGNFDEQFEKWFSDHFVNRDKWIELNAIARKATGAIENNGVYFAQDGRLVQQFQTVNETTLQANIDTVNAFCTDHGVKANIFLVPTAAWGAANELPVGASDVDQKALLQEIKQKFPDQTFIDYTELASPSPNLYYRTDHHWNEKGAYQGYVAIASQVLNKIPNAFIYTEVSDSFEGTMYSRSGAFWVSPDPIYEIDPDGSDLQVSVSYDDGDTVTDSLYSTDRLSTKDQYAYYVDGNHAYVDIKTNMNTNKKAVIVKDSYAHILMPFLATEYSEIQMVDLRYYRGNVSDLLDDQTDLYFIYSLDNFCTDPNLAFLN
ncbi:MAG: DHHW family protein [Galactobacillus timonensis]|uniref:DHHW family protein n=1 Tax=Galactobacillus timonensis TaxID=2041840 RepID=UPI000C825C76|nr:DHHW family protein [Galactobacillus timonensis]MDD6599719.1 DHHW family protein [Galactobacillus timonensis]